MEEFTIARTVSKSNGFTSLKSDSTFEYTKSPSLQGLPPGTPVMCVKINRSLIQLGLSGYASARPGE